MLSQIADGVWVHESETLQSNGVVVQGRGGVLLIDPGLTHDEIACLANDIEELGQPVVAGFSTHPHWDHVLWSDKLGDAPRWGTARGAAEIAAFLSNPNWKVDIPEEFPPEIADEVPLDLLGQITGLPAEAAEVPWDGPTIRIIEHQAHSQGHAALLIEEPRVLVVGDMLSDGLIPMLDLSAGDAVESYLDGLRLLAGVADRTDVLVPGHGSAGSGDELRARIVLDRAYVEALRQGGGSDDPRLQPSAPNGEWLPSVHEWQAQQLAGKET